MRAIGMGLVAAAALAHLASTPATAQNLERDGWWSPLVLQATTGDPNGSILGDVVLGRAPQGGADRTRQNDRNNQRSGGTGDVRGNQRSGDVGNSGNSGNGPPFCRNGQGHPVHGMRWCQEKGWTGGLSWGRASWEDVIFRRPAPQQGQGQGGRVTQPTIADILGSVVLGRLTASGRDAGLSGSVDGRWLPLASGGTVLQLRMGGVPLAELADLNRDGRADVVLLNR